MDNLDDILASLGHAASLLQTLTRISAELRATASETDKAKIDAKLAQIRPANDAAFDAAMAELDAAKGR